LVKQDCNEDLYCCTPDTSPIEMLRTTLLRSGPIALFTRFDTRFHIVRTEPDPECQIWREKWDPLRWCPPEWFEAYRDHVPGRNHGQSHFAVSAAEIDWSCYDLVISVDVAIPERITRRHPETVFAYYVREIKAPSHASSFEAPIAGQDIFLSQSVNPWPRSGARHVVHFPYHYQYCGVFHELAGLDFYQDRKGIFVDYHSAREMTEWQLRALERFGPVYAKRLEDDRVDPVDGRQVPHRSMEPDAFEALTEARYYVKWAGRSTLGTGKMEAIAAGCLALASPQGDGTRAFHSSLSAPEDFQALLASIERFENDTETRNGELVKQRRMMDHVGFHRPTAALIRAVSRHRSRLTASGSGKQ